MKNEHVKGFSKFIGESDEFRNPTREQDSNAEDDYSLLMGLILLHQREPDKWGMPDTEDRYLRVKVSPSELNLPSFHYNDYAYELDTDWAEIRINLKNVSTLEISANYTNRDDGNSYDGTWNYNGDIDIVSFKSFMQVIDDFNSTEGLDHPSQPEGDWYHD